MTKEAALHAFWSGFGIPAFQEDAVPTGDDRPAYPYITYEAADDDFGEEVPVAVNVWYRTSQWAVPNAKAREIAHRITRGGIMLKCDGGAIWVKRGTPFMRSTGDESDDMIRRKILNIILEFITED